MDSTVAREQGILYQMRYFVLICLLFLANSWSAESIPLPGQSYTIGKGLQAGMGIGALHKSSCKSRFVWQGGFEYAYTPEWSGGAAARLFGGDIDNQHSLVSTRYFLMSRRHFLVAKGLDLYAGLSGGFDNASFQQVRDELFNENVVDQGNSNDLCLDAFDFNGASIGIDLGLGWAFLEKMGISYSTQVEVSTNADIRFGFRTGLAYNIHSSWKRLEQNLLAAWLQIEWLHSRTIGVQGATDQLLFGYILGF